MIIEKNKGDNDGARYRIFRPKDYQAFSRPELGSRSYMGSEARDSGLSYRYVAGVGCLQLGM